MSRFARDIIIILVSVAGGLSAATLYFQWPKEPDTYVVTTKERCLTEDGVSFSLKYRGDGTAQFRVVPPTTTTLPGKGKKEAVK